MKKILSGLIMLLLVSINPAITLAQDTDTETLIQQIMAATDAELIQTVPSPDEKFIAEVTVYSCVDIGEGIDYAYEQLELIDSETDERQLIAEQLISCGGLGASGLFVLRWSEHFVYFTTAREGVPDGLATGWVPTLQRASLEDMTVDNINQASFSPLGMWLAMWNSEQISVLEMDAELDSAMSFALQPEDMALQGVYWLPDASGIIYMQADAPFNATQSSVTHIDLTTMEQSVVVDTRE